MRIVLRLLESVLLKRYTAKLKALDVGTGEAVFATLGVVDRDGDVTVPGAFGEQNAKLAGAHNWSGPTIGLAAIKESGDDAIASFRFNLEMDSASEWYKSLKFNFDNGLDQQWSYGFDIMEEAFEDRDGRRVRLLKRLKVHEVSPVMVGAGIATRTTAIKGADGKTMEQEFSALIESSTQFLERCKALTSLRARRDLSVRNQDRLRELVGRLDYIKAEIDTLLSKEPDPLVYRAYLDYRGITNLGR